MKMIVIRRCKNEEFFNLVRQTLYELEDNRFIEGEKIDRNEESDKIVISQEIMKFVLLYKEESFKPFLKMKKAHKKLKGCR